jgi:hypothetical protein
MKFFFLLLLLIGSGIIVAILSRPIEQLTTAVQGLVQWSDRFMTKRHKATAALQAAGRAGASRQRPLASDGWRHAAQF